MIFLLFSCKKEENPTNPRATTFDSSVYDVSLDLASEVALNFSNGTKFHNQSRRMKSKSEEVDTPSHEISEVLIVPSEDGTPALYIINFSPKGYVIISGTQKMTHS